jgi:four helix bundle protein
MASSVGNRPPVSGKRHEQLKAWVACHQLVLAIYEASDSWPSRELYGLTSQVRRAACSAASNIVEGEARRGPKQFRRFLDFAIGSLAELSYLLVLARELGYLGRDKWGELEALRDHAGRLTWGLYSAIRKATTSSQASG